MTREELKEVLETNPVVGARVRVTAAGRWHGMEGKCTYVTSTGSIYVLFESRKTPVMFRPGEVRHASPDEKSLLDTRP